jgi:Major Facilitator Superfamily
MVDTTDSEAREPARPSALVEGIFRREIWPWGLLGITSGLVEGSTVAILVKKGYAGLVDPTWVNLAVAFLSGAPAIANISSFAWANMAHGRARVSVLATLQAVFAIVVGLIALIPFGPTGLMVTIGLVLVARLIWAGIQTVRAAVWTANYPRAVLARMTGRIVMISSPGVALVALAAGWVLDKSVNASRLLYIVAALSGLVAAWMFRSVRVRREYQMLAAEADAGSGGSAFSLRQFREILDGNPSYRSFMFWMSLYGAGNLMVNAQLVVFYADRLHLGGLTQIMLLSVVPLLLIPVFIPWWARQFDGGHVIEYRARQCWVLVCSIVINALAVWQRQPWLLWLGSALCGVSYAGANLGWNLGHNDFAPRGLAQHYMGVHVTLTGVRGLIAPPLGILLYELLEWWHKGYGIAALSVPILLVTAGGLGFVHMRNARRTL